MAIVQLSIRLSKPCIFAIFKNDIPAVCAKQRIMPHTVERLFNFQQQHTGRKYCCHSRRYMFCHP
jgi:hypothetical protein